MTINTEFIDLTKFFEKTLDDLPCHYDTKAYIVSIYTKYKKAQCDLSKNSLTLLYASAKENQDFSSFQDIGDWLFFTKSLYPESLHGASEDYYHTLGRLSYYSCFKILKKQWRSFEELADNFITLEKEATIRIRSNLSRSLIFTPVIG